MTTYVGTQVGSAPYRAVAYIEATFPNGQTYTGSGYLVGPNDVLTASHVVYSVADGGLATSVTVYAGRDGASQPYGAVQGQRIDYFQTDLDGDGLFTRSDSEDDFAVIGLGTRDLLTRLAPRSTTAEQMSTMAFLGVAGAGLPVWSR